MAVKSITATTDAQKNRQAILNQQLTGKQQGGVKLTTSPNVVSMKASTASGSLLKGLSSSVPTPQKAENNLNVNTNSGQNAAYNTPSGATIQAPEPVAYTQPTSTLENKGNQAISDAYTSSLQDLGFASGSLSTIQKLINMMPEDTNEQRIQKKKAQSSLSGLSSSGVSFFDNPYNTDQTAEGQLVDREKLKKDIEQRQTSQTDYLKGQIEGQNALDEAQLAKSASQGRAASSATSAQMAQGREGVQSFGNKMFATEFSNQVEKDIQLSSQQLELLEQQRAKQLADLEQANKDQNEQVAASLSESLAATGSQIQALKAKAQAAGEEQSKQAVENLTKFSSLSSSLSTPFAQEIAKMDVQSIANAFGLDQNMASIVKMSAINKAAIDPNDPDYRIKMANATKAENEAVYGGMTPEQRNYAFAANLTGTAKDEFLNFAGKNPTYGFTTIGNKIFATNPLTGTVEMVSGNNSGGTKLMPSGQFATGEINGKNVTLDQNALFALQTANGAAMDAGVGAISVSSSTRDQKQTILTMAAKWGVDVDPTSIESVNQAAAKLTAMGHSVAPVGMSNHEKGLAIDIYPSDPASQGSGGAQAYISKIKPYLEANGWVQSTDPNDKGHFNYVGSTVYSDEQKAVMDSISLSDYTSTSRQSLESAGLEYTDLATYKKTQGLTPEQKVAAENVKIKTQAALDAIQSIYDNELWKSAGRSALLFPGFQIGVQDLQAQLDTISSNIALDEMKALKEASKTGSTGFGAMSEKELTLLTSSKGSLKTNMSEDLLKSNLEKIKQILLKANGISNDPTNTQAQRKVEFISNPSLIQQVYTQIQNEINAGVSEEEIKAELERNGYDSTQFFKN